MFYLVFLLEIIWTILNLEIFFYKYIHSFDFFFHCYLFTFEMGSYSLAQVVLGLTI